MFEVTYDEFTVLCQSSGFPGLYSEYRNNAVLAEEFDLEDRDEAKWCFLGVRRGSKWPFLTVAQKYWPDGAGFEPGALLVPETSTLFIGAGERLLAYDLKAPKRLWLDSADTGFWQWDRQSDFVLMAAELEFAAWTKEGTKLWTTFVEPPWDYVLTQDSGVLDIMGKKMPFTLLHGPDRA